ncbi:MAG: FtsX-like permease family protein [Rectinemataceae bacterium]|jgi:putative ABC transport system permease protein
MPVLFRIAFRNLLEHKAKSLIIGVLLALGVVILVVGNSFMDTAARGVKDTFIGNYTGDIFIAAKAKAPVSLFGVASVGGRDSTDNLPYFDKVAAKVRNEPGVTDVTSQVTGFAMVSLKDAPTSGPASEAVAEANGQSFALLFGIDPTSYYKLFRNATPIQGRLLEPGEEGIVVSKATIDRFKKGLGVEPKVGETLLLTGIGKSGFKIRSVPLVGIVSFKNESPATDFISYADVNTVRILQGLTLGNDEDTPVTAEQKNLLDASGDDLFGGETVVTTSAVKKPVAPVRRSPAAPRMLSQADTGAWHFIMARLKNPAAAPSVIASLNLWFAKEGIDALASDWKAAAGPFASSIDVVRVVFNIAIIIVAVVAVIIMMNTLVISVIERTGEIGTMRALGAQKGFVRRMFLAETLTIAFVFGLIGTAVALGAVGVINALHLKATNDFLKILFAGNVLHTSVSLASVVGSLFLVGLVAVAAHLYPVSLALKVQPVRAMQTE